MQITVCYMYLFWGFIELSNAELINELHRDKRRASCHEKVSGENKSEVISVQHLRPLEAASFPTY